jgi:hypothetical protein
MASEDHCPPHLHGHHKGEGWVVRLWFSFASDAVGVMTIAPAQNAVRQRLLNQMLSEIVANVDECRMMWWEGKKTTCLENKWRVRTSPRDMIELNERRPDARQVQSANYDTRTRTTVLTFWDGSEDFIGSGDAG